MAEITEKKKNIIWRALDERLGLSRLAYRVPRYANSLPYMLGGSALACFIILAITGIFIAQFYNPSNAYQSIVYMITKVPLGNFLRSLHYWAANAFILIILLHLIRVFISGSYKKPRELTWLTGLALLALALGFFFTGTALKQDQEAVEALTHNIGVGELLGSIGTWFTSGFALSVSIVARVLFAHITILVFFFLGVLALHLYLIKLHGISPKPGPEAVSRATAGEGKSHFTVHLKKLAGYGLLLFAILGALAVLFPAPLGTPGVYGLEITKPAWLFLPFYGMEDLFGFPAIIWGPTILFLLLASIPFLDRSPYLSPRRRKPIMIFGVIILTALIGLGLEAHFHPIEMSGTGSVEPQAQYSFLAPVAYAHAIPMITVSPDKLTPGQALTVSGDGMSETGAYSLSMESESSTIALGSTEIATGNDSFDADFTITSTTAPGSYVIKAVNVATGHAFYSLSEFFIFPARPTSIPVIASAANAGIPDTATPLETTAIFIVLALATIGGVILIRSASPKEF